MDGCDNSVLRGFRWQGTIWLVSANSMAFPGCGLKYQENRHASKVDILALQKMADSLGIRTHLNLG